MKDWLQLVWLRLVVLKRNLFEYIRVVFRYYLTSWNFCKIDMTLLSHYFLYSPYGISKRFLLARGEKDIYTYGETPLTTLELIAKECKISAKDIVFELGSGRGRSCFWMRQFIGCRVVGIEYIPEFVVYASAVKNNRGVQDIEFRRQDMLDADFTEATVIYLYGTCLEDDFLRKLAKKLSALPPGTKVITVSYPLTDYNPNFEVMRRFPATFTWGETDVFLQLTL